MKNIFLEGELEKDSVTEKISATAASVNEFLTFRRYDILERKGRVSALQAKQKAEAEYVEFNQHQQITSDFDREVKRLLDTN